MIFNLFFLFSNVETNQYKLKDLFDIRQGKLILNSEANTKAAELDSKQPTNEPLELIDVLTLNSVNWELSTIKPESLFSIPTPKTAPQPLTNNDYIINRVGLTKGCSLLESDFDFESHQVMPSHHFLVCSPRKIILDKLPFFHAVLEIFLFDLVAKKLTSNENEAAVKTTKQKLTYVTVKEIQNIEVEIPSENFDMIVSQFDQYYNMYAASYKNYISATTNLNSHKLELSKFLKKEFDWNK
jgi:hypothetical protein